MLPSRCITVPQWQVPLPNPPEQLPINTGPRDEAIRVAFAAFDIPVQLPDLPLEALHDYGVQVNAIDDYLKCIFGLPHQTEMIGPRVARYMEGLDREISDTPYALSSSRLIALVAFYIGVCQRRAFNAAHEFDTSGLTGFVAARLAVPKEALKNTLIDSPTGMYVFLGMRCNPEAQKLAIYDSQGHDLVAPRPTLQFDEVANAPNSSGYLRNITISMQTLHAVQLTAIDFSGALIESCAFIGSEFRNANFTDAIFRDTFASQCTFTDTNFTRATFRDGRLSHTHFQKCPMEAVSFHATTLQSLRFNQCDLRNMVLDNDGRCYVSTRLSIEQSDFRACNLTGAVLRHLQYNDGAFNDCLMWDANISHCVFARTVWRHQLATLTKPPLSGATLNEVNFLTCNLTQLNGDDSQWQHCAFENGKLTDASWRRGKLSIIRFSSVEMPRVRFDNAVCQDLRIEAKCNLEGISFANAKLSKLRFDRGRGTTMFRLNGADFSATTLEDAHFVRCQLARAKFVFAQLHEVSFERCNLNHSDFTRSTGAVLIEMLMLNHMKHYRSEGISLADGDIGSLRNPKRRALLLNHFNNRYCLLSNVLSGSGGETMAALVLKIADRVLSEARDPADADAWMVAALSQAHANVPFDADARVRIDRHLIRILQRHLPSLNDLNWRSRPENRWAPDAFDHLRRLLRSQPEQIDTL